MGDTFLTVKEKRDSEALELMRANQENTMQTLVMDVRNLQLDEANKSLEALRTSRSGLWHATLIKVHSLEQLQLPLLS